MSIPVTVHGTGVAACACIRLLQRQQIRPSFQSETKQGGPTLLLNTATLQFLRDVFELDHRFLTGLHRVRRRVVRWGETDTVALAHDGFTIREPRLLDRLWHTVASEAEPSGSAAFHIYSAAGHSGGEVKTFGTRLATNLRMTIEPEASDACWVESVLGGWLFLTPHSNTSGALLVVGGEPGELLAQSKLIAPQVHAFEIQSSGIPVAPRLAQPLCDSDWLACGSAAMAFDPICGEGVGNAVREAILGCASLRHPNRESALQEYAPRLMLGFLKHLELCRGFYASGGGGPWWAEQLNQLEQGIASVRQQVTEFAPPRYRLRDFELRSLS